MRSCLVDGEIATHVPADDRALAYGDGVFETLAVVGGQPRFWQQHMNRLALGCERCQEACFLFLEEFDSGSEAKAPLDSRIKKWAETRLRKSD